MTITSAQFSEFLWPGLNGKFGTQYKEYSPMWKKLCFVTDSDKQFEKYQGITGFGLLGVKDQGAQIGSQDFYQGFQKEIVNVVYGTMVAVTLEMLKYEQYNIINQIPTELAKSLRATEETVVANVLNLGFSGTTVASQTADKLPLFSLVHRKVDGTTFANTPSTGADLTQTALEDAYVTLSNFQDDQSIPRVIMPEVLAVSTADQFNARRLLETQYDVASANNAINPVSRANMPIELVVNPYFTDTDAWFIKTDVQMGIVFQEVQGASIDRENDFATKNENISLHRIFGVGGVEARGYYGSPGV